MEVELILTNYNSQGNQTEKTSKEKDTSKKDDPNAPAPYKVLSSFKCKIANASSGVHEYVPVIFEDQHFAVAGVTFHSTLLGNSGYSWNFA